MEKINHIEDLTRDAEESQALESLATLEVSAHQPEDAEPAADESDHLPDVNDADIELNNWRASVEAYVATQVQPFTVDDVLEHGMHFTPGGWDRSEQMRCAAILRELGFDRQQRRIDGVRAQYWSSPTMVAFESRASGVSPPATATAEHVPATPDEGGSIIGDAACPDLESDQAGDEPNQTSNPEGLDLKSEPAQSDLKSDSAEAAEAARDRYTRLSARQTEIKRKLADAQRAAHFATDARRKAALAAVEGGFTAEASYYKAVEADKEAGARVEQLQAALAAIGTDLQRAIVYAEAERRRLQCKAVRDMARAVETYGPRIEGLLVELGKAVSGYMHDINVVYRKSWSVMTGAREVAAPQTDPVACALMGQFLRSSGLDPSFFTELTSHGMNGLLRFEPPSQIVDMQLANITERLVDNNWSMVNVQEADPEAEERAAAVLAPGHELVPQGIYPNTLPADAEGDEA